MIPVNVFESVLRTAPPPDSIDVLGNCKLAGQLDFGVHVRSAIGKLLGRASCFVLK